MMMKMRNVLSAQQIKYQYFIIFWCIFHSILLLVSFSYLFITNLL